MKYCLPLLIWVLPFYASSQSYMSARIGLSVTNTSPASYDGDFKLGFSGGVGYEKFLGDHFSMSADLRYNQLGYALKFMMRNSMGEGLGDGKFKTKLNYIALPIKAGYYVGNKIRFYGKVGIVPSFLVSAKDRIPMDNPSGTGIEYRKVKSTDNYKRFDFAVLLEIGVVYEIDNRLLVFSSFQYQHSVTSFGGFRTYDGNSVATTDFRHYGLTLSAGVKRKL